MSSIPTQMPEEWADREYREAYMEAAVNYGLAWQIQVNREARGMGRYELSQILKSVKARPYSVKALEDPDVWEKRLKGLKALAKIFDCALLVKFVPYSELAKESEGLSPQALFARPYAQEAGADVGQKPHKTP